MVNYTLIAACRELVKSAEFFISAELTENRPGWLSADLTSADLTIYRRGLVKSAEFFISAELTENRPGWLSADLT